MNTLPVLLRRPLRALAALVPAVVVSLTGSAAPAAAAASNPPGVHILSEWGDAPGCPTGWLCLFNAPSYNTFAVGVLPGIELPEVKRVSNSDGYVMYGALSVVNNTSLTYCAHPNENYGGTAVKVKPGDKVPDTKVEWKSLRPC
ncbi:hypothetical protein ACIQ9E_03460 [Streptomyces sp. NPDC094448]|uniref:hypothetical protein n=1 Tax=Streptomyces sp. NPDC094448 TaxID=3366063 RepID=UPI00380B1609